MASIVMAALALTLSGAALCGALLLWMVLREAEPRPKKPLFSDEELRQWADFLNYTGGQSDET